jgi:hypothetical protein
MVPVVCAQAMAGSSAANAPTLRNVDNLLMMDSWFDVILMNCEKGFEFPREAVAWAKQAGPRVTRQRRINSLGGLTRARLEATAPRWDFTRRTCSA